MITKYNQYIKEGLLNNISGPSEEEFFDSLKKYNPEEMLKTSIENNFKRGIEYALDNGANFDELLPHYKLQAYLLFEYTDLEIIKEIGLENILNRFPKTPEEYIDKVLSDIAPYPKDDTLVGDSVYWGKGGLKLLKVNRYVFVSYEYIWMILSYIYSLSDDEITKLIIDYLHNKKGWENVEMINAVHKWFFKWDEQTRKKTR